MPRFINLEMTKELLSIQEFSDQDWLNRLYRKSESTRIRRVSESALKMFDLFCEHEKITQWLHD